MITKYKIKLSAALGLVEDHADGVGARPGVRYLIYMPGWRGPGD